MKYKVGDIVKLRDDLEDYYGGHYYGYSTEELKTDPFKITEANEYYYTLDDMYDWCITDKMIEGLWEENKPKYKLIDILNKIANGKLKIGSKIIWGGKIYTYYGDDDFYECISEFETNLWEDMSIGSLNEEVELIEPQELKECEHEWSKYSIGRLGRTENYRRCKKCGIHEEDIEPTDNTKIEELKTYENSVMDILYKLNEVIRKINK